MKNKVIFIMTGISSLLVFSQIFLMIQLISFKQDFLKLNKKIENLSNKLSEYQENEELRISEINSRIDNLVEMSADIKGDLAHIHKKSDEQFNQTLSIRNNYDEILEEQKKKTINTAESDKELLNTKSNALDLYKKGNYRAAYEEYRKITELYRDDMVSRLYKIKSLYYMNKADSSKHNEILGDIQILKQNGMADSECLEIEKAIKTEKDGLNE